MKLQTFVFSGCLAGLAGALYVLVLAPAAPARAPSRRRARSRCSRYAVIGGLGSVAGAISGVALLPHPRLRAGQARSAATPSTILRLSLSGAGLLWILYFLPGGLWQLVQRVRDRYLRWVADRHDLLVPSLVADKRVEDEGPAPDDDHAEDETSVIAGALS